MAICWLWQDIVCSCSGMVRCFDKVETVFEAAAGTGAWYSQMCHIVSVSRCAPDESELGESTLSALESRGATGGADFGTVTSSGALNAVVDMNFVFA